MFRQIGPIELFIILFVLIPYVWAIIDIIHRPVSQFPNGTGKTGWLVALIVGTFIGLGWLIAIVYLILVRKRQGPVRPTGPESPPSVPAD
jgi:hypothetical protein